MNPERYIERIEQYESSEMTAVERKEFEAELASSVELQQAHKLYQEANDVIEQGIENNLRNQLNGWQSAQLGTKEKTRLVLLNITWVRLAIAASFALLIGWFGLGWTGKQFTDQALFADNYDMPQASNFRSAGSQAHPLQAGYDAFLKGEFATAATVLGNISSDDEYYAEAQYYIGHSNVQAKDYKAAEDAFKASAANQSSKFREKAEWNLAIVLMASSKTDTDEFKALLEQIANNPDHSYKEQARSLKGNLGTFWRNKAK